MKIPLAQMARRASNLRRKSVTLRPIMTTQAQAQDLSAIYMNVLRVWQIGARDQILPAYAQTLEQQAATRDSIPDIDAAISRTEGGALQAILNFGNLFLGWASRLQLWHMSKFIAQIKYVTNVDLTTLIGPADMRMTIEQILARNTALVRDVSDATRAKISDAVFRGLQARTPVSEVAKEISKITGLARDRSVRIASDQTVKLSASLDRERQLQVGMTEFEWLSSHKVHYRPEHQARDNKVFAWDSEVGRNDPPGWLPYCGCHAKGILRFDDAD